jgi:glycosyltransferase involved in cell wall biosynthesis
MARRRITVLTSGHVALCPRMLKAADALAEAGHAVRMVSARFIGWATEADRALGAGRTGRWSGGWEVVDYGPDPRGPLYWKSGLRLRAARALARGLSPRHLPWRWAARAGSRAFDELAALAAAAPADLIYGGTTGGIAPAAEAARRLGIPYAVDLEDLHSAERPGNEPGGALANAVNARVERRVLPGAAFRTAGSAAIATAYRERYGVEVIPVHNTFPLPSPPAFVERLPGPLRLAWFSQTIGPGRGLEEAVAAVGLAGLAAELHLRGNPAPGYLEGLAAAAARDAPRLRVLTHPPVPPDDLLDTLRACDVGLACDLGFSESNRLALSNKALTYPLAGLAVAISTTPGQAELARDLGEGAAVYAPGDAAALAAGLARWAADPALLARAKVRAWETARRRWHWEHPADRGALLAAVERVTGP